MPLENKEKIIKENLTPITETDVNNEYDEDLEELLGEEYISLEKNEIEDNDCQENNSIESSLDINIEKNISSFLAWGEVIKWLMIILGIIIFIICLTSKEEILSGIFMLIIFIIYGFLSSMLLKWFGYVLKCLKDIKNK